MNNKVETAKALHFAFLLAAAYPNQKIHNVKAIRRAFRGLNLRQAVDLHDIAQDAVDKTAKWDNNNDIHAELARRFDYFG